ncbi:MAG TPA: hypothetical protein VFZ09_03975 [Archangium sp.]|uniref:hypothetical protein n=1 Tax=Archangium sp. TaxID=1872627 RepID=UPI002E2FA707|nr:hypothetical protein [Archangium sp.]HEX5745377.1 hypothetical protein [Archangium sp.]
MRSTWRPAAAFASFLSAFHRSSAAWAFPASSFFVGLGRSLSRAPVASFTNGLSCSSKPTVKVRSPKSSGSEPFSSSPRSGTSRSASSSRVRPRASAICSIFSRAFSWSPLNFTFSAMPLR